MARSPRSTAVVGLTPISRQPGFAHDLRLSRKHCSNHDIASLFCSLRLRLSSTVMVRPLLCPSQQYQSCSINSDADILLLLAWTAADCEVYNRSGFTSIRWLSAATVAMSTALPAQCLRIQ